MAFGLLLWTLMKVSCRFLSLIYQILSGCLILLALTSYAQGPEKNPLVVLAPKAKGPSKSNVATKFVSADPVIYPYGTDVAIKSKTNPRKIAKPILVAA